MPENRGLNDSRGPTCVQGLGAESNISDVGSVSIDNKSIDKLIELIKSVVEKSTAHSAKEKLVTTTHTEIFH